MANSATRSIVHHQSAKPLLSARDRLMTPPARVERRASATSARNASPRCLEIVELIEGGAGRRQQHDRRGDGRRARIGDGAAHRLIERAGDLIRRLAVQACGRNLRRLADQIGFADAGEKRHEAFDAAFLGLAAGDPENIGKQTSARAAASALVALESLTKRTLPMRPTSSMRWARPGKLGDRRGDGARILHEGLGRGIGERRVLPVVRAGQMRAPPPDPSPWRRANPRRHRARRRPQRRRDPAPCRPRPESPRRRHSTTSAYEIAAEYAHRPRRSRPGRSWRVWFSSRALMAA